HRELYRRSIHHPEAQRSRSGHQHGADVPGSRGGADMSTSAVLFWLAVCGVLYPYIAYPAVLSVLGRKRRREGREAHTNELPSVSMIIPVHNEATRIKRKIANTASLDYPRDR